MIPLVDLKAQYEGIRQEIQEAIERVITNCAFIQGREVEAFEQAFADLHQAKHCIAVSSGTSALHASLLAAGIGPGDEVIVPVNTFIATAEAVQHCGARPVFVDMSAADYCIDPDKIEPAITPKTKAVIPVHLYGQPAEMDRIMAIAAQHALMVLEDCAQAHDAEYRGRKVGTFGRAGTFSFYPAKNLGAYGEGGGILTNDDDLADHLRKLRSHGSVVKYVHHFTGYNYRMHGIQGAILAAKTKHLPAWTKARRKVAELYRSAIADLPVVVSAEKPEVTHVYHLFVVRVENRDGVLGAMHRNGIGCGIHYPHPLHMTPAFDGLGYRAGDFPVAETAAAEILSLPLYPEMTPGMVDRVVESLKTALGEPAVRE